jgi:hypothetical protein
MPEIMDSTMHGPIFDAQGMVFEDQALANAGAIVSAEFLFPQTMGGTQLNLVAGAAGVITGVGETLEISLATADESGGTFNNVIFTKTIPASQTFVAGDIIASFVPPRELEEVYSKLTITSDFNALLFNVSAYQVGVAHS